ncbi:MAG: 4-hydroxyphenylacetate 3-hydroxylase N-terminal domain-containing protein [Acidimicrobiia bacterium]
MGARTGKEYLDGLRDDRAIWLEGERVPDVTDHPAFAGALRTMVELYDLQHTSADVCLVRESGTGESRNASHVIPRSREDLARRHAALRRTAEHTVGLMGRTPDYLNVTVAGFAGRADVWAGDGGNEAGAAHLVAYQEELARRDLALTHTIVHPTVDKSIPEVDAGDGEVAVHKIADTAHGIVVRGARVLATLAPFADELLVYTGQPIPKDAARYALSFVVPVSTPGLKVLCRDSFSSRHGRFDRPFSSRFDEQDAFVIFDDVEVPRERVFIDGDVDVYNRVMTAGWVANVMQQTTIRAHVKLEFAYELATRMADAINADDAATKEMLGELWTYGELTRAALAAAEAGAADCGNGTWFCDERPFRALRPTLPRWFPRVNEILKLLGSHNLLATPSAGDFDDPELSTLLPRYFQGANGVGARERVALFRAAWDFAASSLGERNELYERYYLASASRTYQLAHQVARREIDGSLVDSVLA